MSRVRGRVLGIDFGTTHTTAAVLDGDVLRVIANSEGLRSTPAVVAFARQAGEKVLVGSAAARQLLANPHNTIVAIKRLLGRKVSDPEVRRHQQDVAYEIVAGKNGDACVRVQGRKVVPAEIASMILRDLKASAEMALGEPVAEAVIAVPATFDDAQRRALHQAGTLAGLTITRIINEPTAAALAYAFQAGFAGRGEQKLLVYDLGGGTFDVSAVSLQGEELSVRAAAGDDFLGGDDFDQRIATHLADLFQKEHGIDLRREPVAALRLTEAARAAKHALSQAQATELTLSVEVAAGKSASRAGRTRPGGMRTLAITLTRAECEAMTKDLVDRTLFSCDTVLADARWSPGDVDAVVLVGAHAQMPRVQQQLTEFFGKAPVTAVDPEEAVAMGAAVIGAAKQGTGPAVQVVELAAVSLGVETAGGVFTRVIPRNTALPVARDYLTATTKDNQQQLEIHVVQGEREMAADNKSLGRFVIAPIPPAPRGAAQVRVRLSVDESGLVSVSAVDLATVERQELPLSEPAWQGG